jgi:ABC-type proline/glycine betaine transport system permease subunit
VTALLSTPHFLVSSIIHAFISAIAVSVAIVVYVTLYVAVLVERGFEREVVETTSLLYLIDRAIGVHLNL